MLWFKAGSEEGENYLCSPLHFCSCCCWLLRRWRINSTNASTKLKFPTFILLASDLCPLPSSAKLIGDGMDYPPLTSLTCSLCFCRRATTWKLLDDMGQDQRKSRTLWKFGIDDWFWSCRFKRSPTPTPNWLSDWHDTDKQEATEGNRISLKVSS